LFCLVTGLLALAIAPHARAAPPLGHKLINGIPCRTEG
jgi:hypothetical protein